MNGKTHQLVGITGGVLAATILYETGIFELLPCLSTIAMSSLGSLIPDIDHTGSIAGKKIPIFSYPIRWLSQFFLWLNRVTKVKFFYNIGKLFSHRGIFHSPLMWMIGFIILIVNSKKFFADIPLMNHIVFCGIIGLWIGIILHLLADMLNPTGIPLFMPISNRKYSIGKIVTGSAAESIFKYIMIGCFIMVCTYAVFTFLGAR